MTWHLKDESLEKKLNELSNGEFSMNLFKRSDGNFMSCFGKKKAFIKPCVLGKEVTEFHQFVVYFTEDEVEDIPEYDPNDWNEYPSVTPPEEVLMRVECTYGKETFRYCAIFKKGVWWHEKDGDCDGNRFISVKRFRPWDGA